MADRADKPLLTWNLLACFSTFLTTEVVPTKWPLGGWGISLRRDLTTGPITTGRVFFESGGAQAWAAYEAVRTTDAPCHGQTDIRDSFAELDRQPLDFKANLARMVGDVVPHPTVGDFIAPIARMAHSLLGRPVDAEPSVPVAPTPPKRRRTDECSPEASAGPLLHPPPRPPAARHCENPLLAVRPHDNTSPAAGGQIGQAAEIDQYRGAHIRGLFELLPPYMAGAIKWYEINGTARAGVTMQFPRRDLNLPCAITFDISEQKVEFLAWKLFNAHLERHGPVLVLQYDNDARTAKIGPGFYLRSCTTEVIPGLFGPLITSGNVASPQRQREVTADITNTVVMQLHGEVGRGALITLSLGSVEASQIFEKLYTQ